MIRINQIKLPVTHSEADLRKKAAKLLKIPEQKITFFKIVKQSLDARKKEGLLYIYSVEIQTEEEEEPIVTRAGNVNIVIGKEKPYLFPAGGTEKLKHRPIIIGSGPAGLFCGLMLARAGYRPVILERGEDVDRRRARVDTFWKGGPLLPDSNVQFGEGGAGTFSDGKLNTLVKDPSGRNLEVLRLFVEAGADPSILYVNKPHIGTDVLAGIIKTMREEILRLGGEVRFQSRVTDLLIEKGAVTGVVISRTGQEPQSALSAQGKSAEGKAAAGERVAEEFLLSDTVVLAVGHSARDTFEMLSRKPLHMEPKAFAVGLRIQHPQSQIDLSQYKSEGMEKLLGAASYKLTRQTSGGRGVFSFCMCPGGFVVDASSEEGRLAVNGMSYHRRDGANANSAMIVTVTPEDFPDRTALGGLAFQRSLEKAAYCQGNGKIPVQLYGDYKADRVSADFGEVSPAFLGGYVFGNLRNVLPPALNQSLIEGIDSLNGVIKNFSRYDAILAGVESRTSSPLRIPRDENYESCIRGLYPCGEGAGYAGGITSAAMDGIRTAEMIAGRFAPQN